MTKWYQYVVNNAQKISKAILKQTGIKVSTKDVKNMTEVYSKDSDSSGVFTLVHERLHLLAIRLVEDCEENQILVICKLYALVASCPTCIPLSVNVTNENFEKLKATPQKSFNDIALLGFCTNEAR